MKKFFFAALGLLWSFSAEARIYVPIDQPSDKKMPIAITPLMRGEGGSKGVAKEIPEIIQNDLTLSGYFEFIPPDAFLEPAGSSAVTTETIPFDLWTAIEAQALIKGTVSESGGFLKIQLRLFDPFLKQMLVGKEYTGTKKELRAIAHRFSDEVMESLTGIRGPFSSRITYAALARGGNKAIFVMDVDGENNYRITNNKTINLGPNWSPDGNKIVFTSFQTGQPELFIANLQSGELKQLTHNRTSNISPRWSKDGSSIMFTTSTTGDPELWTVSLTGKMLEQVTQTHGIDIAPTFSPDGGEIIFSSERAGRLHLFRMPAGGGPANRLTFVGIHNDTPDWSPDGLKVVFCSQDRGHFDLFIMNADGSTIQRLTSGAGDNEHPRWSPDGRYLVYSSSQTGGPAIYMMRADGSNITRLSPGNGQMPDWGPWLR